LDIICTGGFLEVIITLPSITSLNEKMDARIMENMKNKNTNTVPHRKIPTGSRLRLFSG